MSIIYNEERQQFHLFNDEISYIMELINEEYLAQVYYGRKVQTFNQRNPYPHVSRSSFSPSPADWLDRHFTLDAIMQEAPGYDTSDYRQSIIEVTYPDGTQATNFKYESHVIFQGKKPLEGLPATYIVEEDEAQTLEITMLDAHRQFKAILSYTIYTDRAVIAKSIRYVNASPETIVLNKAASACLDLPDYDYELIQMTGSWAREKHLKRDPLTMGIHTFDSKRGASGSAQQPFISLVRPQTTEATGEVYGFHFVYSGNFAIEVEVDNYEQTRVLVGINAHHFSWQLEPNQAFQTPEVIYVYSSQGLNGLSQTYHHLYRERLARGEHQYAERPILINNWETTYFDFNEEKILDLVDGAKELGVELFVLDDGWFGKRNSDKTSLGDWFVNREKLPGGLEQLAEKVKARGLKFGLWFEPEMVSEASELYQAHPDWALQVKDYPLSKGRDQLILDFSRQEVREAIFNQMTAILDVVPIDYIKWDMNRTMTEVGSIGRDAKQQLETSHRYMLGLYDFLERLTTRYPHILFENCSSGGGRFDPGMVHYMPQSWASDNTDAVERLKIQYGNSLVFPTSMICAQLSEVANHQVGRMTNVEMRANVAMSGNFGIMLNLARESQADLAVVKASVEWYKTHRRLIQYGDFYRLISPFESNETAWLFIDQAKEEGVLFYFQILSQASQPLKKVKFQGLDPDSFYEIRGQILSGDELMAYGLYLNHEFYGDFQSKRIPFKKINQ